MGDFKLWVGVGVRIIRPTQTHNYGFGVGVGLTSSFGLNSSYLRRTPTLTSTPTSTTTRILKSPIVCFQYVLSLLLLFYYDHHSSILHCERIVLNTPIITYTHVHFAVFGDYMGEIKRFRMYNTRLTHRYCKYRIFH